MLPVTIDFETTAIGPRPSYPPTPVGVAILWPGKQPRYLAWGHDSSNNSTKGEAAIELKKAWGHPGGILFHNAKFDLEVAQAAFGLPVPAHPDLWHDTLLLAYLYDPHASTFALKPLAQSLLGMEPTERDEVQAWLRDKDICRTKDWGAHISRAPGDLVGRYAVGDVTRTLKLYQKLAPEVRKAKMWPAYEREKRLMPILMRMEQQGIHVVPHLPASCSAYAAMLQKVDAWVCRRLGAKTLNIDSGAELVEAMRRAKKVDVQLLGVTEKTGELRTDKTALERAVTDNVLSAVLRYRGALATGLRTFLDNWRATAQVSGGRVFVGWNQTRNFEKGRPQGAVTGRLSSSPNFQNVPKEFPPLFFHEGNRRDLPKAPFAMDPLPLVREYLAPDPGHVLIDRDYSQQELRILAHFEDDSLKAAYLSDPRMDIHDRATDLISSAMGITLATKEDRDKFRKGVKTTGFGLLYGMGVGRLAASLGISYEEAKTLKTTYLNAFPGLRGLLNGLKELAQVNAPFRTWGGRRYYCEKPKIDGGNVRTFEYKMINVLIQGSAADCTKQAMIEYDRIKPAGHRLLLSVHDELLVSCPAGEVRMGHEALRTAMESVTFDVPMLTDGTVGEHNWGTMRDYDKKGVIL